MAHHPRHRPWGQLELTPVQQWELRVRIPHAVETELLDALSRLLRSAAAAHSPSQETSHESEADG